MVGLLIDTSSGDILVEAGRSQVGNTDAQIAETLLVAWRGEFKEFPLLGGEILSHLNGEWNETWPADVKKQLSACGVGASIVKITDDNVITIK